MNIVDKSSFGKMDSIDKGADPVIIETLNFLKENLPPDSDEEAIFRRVRRLQKLFESLFGLSFEQLYNDAVCEAREIDSTIRANVLEQAVDDKLANCLLAEEKAIKTKHLDASRSSLELQREHYKLIKSIRLDGCMNLISRYNHLVNKK